MASIPSPAVVLLFLSFFFVLLPALPSAYVRLDTSSAPECEFIQNEYLTNLTHRDALFLKSKSLESDTASLDADHQDFDIFLHLMSDANLSRNLKIFSKTDERSTIFVPRDLAIIQTALEMQELMDNNFKPAVKEYGESDELPEVKLFTEAVAYRVFHRFTRRFRTPHLVLLDIIRNHVTPSNISFCTFEQAVKWKTWSNRTIDRSGIYFITGNQLFPNALLYIDENFPQILTSQGIIQHVDRVLMPDLSDYELNPSPSPTSSPSPTPSISPSAGISKEPIPSSSSSPSPQPPTPSASASSIPSTPPIPTISDAFFPFPTNFGNDTLLSSSSPSPTVSPGSDNSSIDSIAQPSENACFPGSALIYLSQNETVPLRNLEIGHEVMTSLTSKSEIFMFSHRIETPPRLFLRLETTNYSITISHGHLLHINDEVRPAAKARLGDFLKTLNGPQKILRIISTWERGLYAPHTMEGFIAVNGIIASCYTTSLKATLAHTLLTPLRAIRRTRVINDPIQGKMDMGVHPVVTATITEIMSKLAFICDAMNVSTFIYTYITLCTLCTIYKVAK